MGPNQESKPPHLTLILMPSMVKTVSFQLLEIQKSQLEFQRTQPLDIDGLSTVRTAVSDSSKPLPNGLKKPPQVSVLVEKEFGLSKLQPQRRTTLEDCHAISSSIFLDLGKMKLFNLNNSELLSIEVQ